MDESSSSHRPLPEAPQPVANSSVRGSPSRGEISPFRDSSVSPARSLRDSQRGSPDRSPFKSQRGNPFVENPFGSGSRPVSPVHMPMISPDRNHSVHGSPYGSPARRVHNSDDESSFSYDTPARELPPSPVYDTSSANLLDHMSPSRNRSVTSMMTSYSLDKEEDFDIGVKLGLNGSDNSRYRNDGESVFSSISTIADDNDDDDDDAYEDIYPPSNPQPRRNKTVSRKQVKLVRGNLVLDCPIPTKLYSFLPRRDLDEFVYMRYSACTADPDEFAESGFTIRPAIYDRGTELCVCITMYNEDEILFTRTLHAVFKNIAYLCQRKRSKVWGPQGWKKVVVTIIADGRQKISPRVLDALAAMGVYQDGVAKNLVNGESVQAHVFEYTAQVSITPEMRFQGAEKQLMPVQIIFCMKEKNARKINSHRWFFNAICPQLNPNVVVLLDVGTKPSTPTLYHLWKAFDEDSNVGGACGEIKTMIGKFGKDLLNPLVAAQNFEYKISNILDKPFESVFGYISVLPGALSAYRYRALENDPTTGEGPLCSYFKGENLDKIDGKSAGIFEKNMYLAEDRILCWELIGKRNEQWVLKYVKEAKGETDVPDTLAEFISQRRRWLNGALFAAVYSQAHFSQIWYTSHSFIRKFCLHLEFIYQFFSMLFTFFSLANYYLAVYYVAGSVAGNSSAAIKGGGGEALFIIVKYLMTLAIAAQFILSLGNRPQGARALFMTTVVILSLITTYVTVIGLYFVCKTFAVSGNSDVSVHTLLTIVIALIGTYGVYGLMSVLFFDPWHIFTSAVQYFLLVPLYVCTLQIYAFCNTHDVTWGTKGDTVQHMDLGAAVVMKDAKGKDIVEIDIPSEQIDIDTGYENALHSLRERIPEEAKPVDHQTKQQDYFREIRSRVVLVWMLCNLLLVMLVTQFIKIDNPGNNVYLQIVLWSTFVFAIIRAIGSTGFLLKQAARSLHKTHLHTKEKFASWKNTYQSN